MAVAVWWPEELELPPDIILNPAHQTHQARLPGLRVEIRLLLLCIGKRFGNLVFINSNGGFGLDMLPIFEIIFRSKIEHPSA